jgi:DNA-binding transcriptional MerR regulator
MSIGTVPPANRYYTDEYLEWMDILKAMETNPTLKDAADQLRVLYKMSKEAQPDAIQELSDGMTNSMLNHINLEILETITETITNGKR